jgi:hypothetical protein
MVWTLRSRRPAAADGFVDDDVANKASGSDLSANNTAPGPDTTPASSNGQRLELSTLPPEIHLAISQLLIYPDALSFKHTNRHFYGLVDTGVELKVEWLMQRRSLHLECPSSVRCDLGSDLRFCRGSVP